MGQVEPARSDRRYTGGDLVVAAVASFLVVTYASLWRGGGEDVFLLAGVFLFGWLAVFFTDLWEPILYFLAGIVLLLFTLFWVIGGLPPRHQSLEWVAILLTVVFSLLVVYLFFTSERFTAD